MTSDHSAWRNSISDVLQRWCADYVQYVSYTVRLDLLNVVYEWRTIISVRNIKGLRLNLPAQYNAHVNEKMLPIKFISSGLWKIFSLSDKNPFMFEPQLAKLGHLQRSEEKNVVCVSTNAAKLLLLPVLNNNRGKYRLLRRLHHSWKSQLQKERTRRGMVRTRRMSSRIHPVLVAESEKCASLQFFSQSNALKNGIILVIRQKCTRYPLVSLVHSVESNC